MPPRSRSSPPPPPPSSRPPRKKHKHKGERRGSLDAKAIDEALEPIVPDPRDRAFVLRCILEEGPRHHRVASFALLRMLSRVLEDVGGAGAAKGASAPLAMRLPPGVASRADDAEFPIGVPTALIGELLDEAGAAEALDCLRDGPPHHALANAAMAWMIQAIHERVRGSRG
jgi:hypothetical protein